MTTFCVCGQLLYVVKEPELSQKEGENEIEKERCQKGGVRMRRRAKTCQDRVIMFFLYFLEEGKKRESRKREKLRNFKLTESFCPRGGEMQQTLQPEALRN